MSLAFLRLFALMAGACASGRPNTCQPRSQHPFMPIYHIIGNVTSDATGKVTGVESINDASAVVLYRGIYHVFHQCCQNHWDHVVSKDLIHWARLPPPIVPGQNPTGVPQDEWYDRHGSFDGALAMPNAWNGIEAPMVMMTSIQGGKPGGGGRIGSVGMAIVRPSNASDPFLLSWTKDVANPMLIDGRDTISSPYDTPGQMWKNGDHWNYLNLGVRYTTKDPTFHNWSAAPGPKFINAGENGGQWFSKLASPKDGGATVSLPDAHEHEHAGAGAGTPGWMINVAGGNVYDLGNYHPGNETWTTVKAKATIDHGPNDNWMAGQFAGDRFMNIGWITGGPPMMVADYPDGDSFRHPRPSTSAARPAAGSGGRGVVAHTPAPSEECPATTHWEVIRGATNIYKRVKVPTNVTQGTLKFIGTFDSAEDCFAAVNATSAKDGPFHSFTYNDATVKDPNFAKHCWADTSMTWQGLCGSHHDRICPGQTSGRGPGFPQTPPLPPATHFTHDHLTGLREVAYETKTGTLVSNPVRELVNLRNGTLGSSKGVTVSPGTWHVVPGTGFPADASTSDVVANISVPSPAAGAVGVSVLTNVSAGGERSPFGGVLAVVNFTAPDAITGIMAATASIRTLDPCMGGNTGVTVAAFPIYRDEKVLDIRVLVDRSLVEVFVMGGRVVFTKTYELPLLYVPDTNVVLQSWGVAATASVDVFSMGCGWADEPWQPHPTLESITTF